MTEIRTDIAASPRRRAKIVCTLGPSSNSEGVIRDLVRLGLDVARLNFSHGTHEDHARVIERIRNVARKEARTLCILQDLQGPKIRTGRLQHGTPVLLKSGSKVVITPRDIPGTASLISTSFQSLSSEVQRGSRILLSDGLLELTVKAVRGADVECLVVNGGLLGEHQGINLPGAVMSIPSLTDKDRGDLQFGLKHGVDVVALSFVRTASDVQEVKRIIAQAGSDCPVIAKLEKPQAIEHLEEIFEVADGVMVARGDLGVEMAPEKVPVIQKHIIARAMEWRKPVITATQMLESMVEHPRPTRAEASDVANAVFDGTDAVMLSAETASGKYPREAVTIMARIIAESEQHMRSINAPRRRDRRNLSASEAICESVAHAAENMDMRAIAVFTQTGTSARLVSKYRPLPPIYGFSHDPAVCDRMNLYWGVQPILWDYIRSSEEMVKGAERELIRRGAAQPGDVVSVISGTRGQAGSTNLLLLQKVGSPMHDRTRVPETAARSSRQRKPPKARKGAR